MLLNFQSVADGKVVTVHYTLKNAAGEVIDSSEGNQPMVYIQGMGNLVPGFEKAVNGKRVGDDFAFEVSAEEGYGERDDEAVQAVPRSVFPKDLEILPGMQFGVTGPDGQPMPVWVGEVHEDSVILDMNHPLAGAVLFFSVRIMDIRDATRDEMAHGHAHGPGGHHH